MSWTSANLYCSLQFDAYFTSTTSHCCVATRSPHKGFNSYKAALLGDHSEEWKRAYAAEIAKLESVGGLRVVPRPSDVTLLPFLEVLTEKIDPVTRDLKYKVRLAARGDLHDTDNDTFAPVPGAQLLIKQHELHIEQQKKPTEHAKEY